MGTRYPGVVQGVFEEQMQLNAVAPGDGTEIVTRGYATLTMSITGPFVGTVTFEARVGAADWAVVRVTPEATGTPATTATVVGMFRYECAAKNAVRARVSAWTSGSISVLGQATSRA